MATSHQGTELRPIQSPAHSLEQETVDDYPSATSGEIEQLPLPPPDEGKAAWLVLAGCSLIQAPVWGFSISFGVFQQYYSSHPNELNGDSANYAVIGTTTTGILYLMSPFTFAILTRWPHLRRWFGPIGLALTAVGFLASAFVRSVDDLIATQGVICALGCGLLFTPTTLYLDEWFIRRKGLAYGIMWAGKSATGVALPFIMETSLRKYGPRPTLLGWTIATVLLSAPLLYFLRPRIPLSHSTAVRRMDLSFLKLPAFWMLQAGNIFQSLGYFLPSTYLSSYAVQEIGLPTSLATLLLALVNVTSVPGGIVIGALGDHVKVTTTIAISTLGSTLAIFCFWGLSSQVALLTIFALTYGFFAGSYSSLYSGIISELKEQSPALDTGLIFGLLAGGRGIGNVISGPLSVALFTREDWLHSGKHWGYNTEYGPIILWTGATALLGGWGCLSKVFSRCL